MERTRSEQVIGIALQSNYFGPGLQDNAYQYTTRFQARNSGGKFLILCIIYKFQLIDWIDEVFSPSKTAKNAIFSSPQKMVVRNHSDPNSLGFDDHSKLSIIYMYLANGKWNTVPIYNMTQGIHFPQCLDNMDKIPHWPNSEPPVGSMCVVAFTTSYWVRPGESLGRLAFNILWIGVIYGEKYVLHLFYL